MYQSASAISHRKWWSAACIAARAVARQLRRRWMGWAIGGGGAGLGGAVRGMLGSCRGRVLRARVDGVLDCLDGSCPMVKGGGGGSGSGGTCSRRSYIYTYVDTLRPVFAHTPWELVAERRFPLGNLGQTYIAVLLPFGYIHQSHPLRPNTLNRFTPPSGMMTNFACVYRLPFTSFNSAAYLCSVSGPVFCGPSTSTHPASLGAGSF